MISTLPLPDSALFIPDPDTIRAEIDRAKERARLLRRLLRLALRLRLHLTTADKIAPPTRREEVARG